MHCQGKAPFGVGTNTANVPTQKIKKAADKLMVDVKSKQKKAM